MLRSVFSYLFSVRGPAAFARIDLGALDFTEGKQHMQSMADVLRKQGHQQGRREGRQEAFLQLLRRKFPQVPAARVAEAEAADLATLHHWLDRLLTATTVDEVFA